MRLLQLNTFPVLSFLLWAGLCPAQLMSQRAPQRTHSSVLGRWTNSTPAEPWNHPGLRAFHGGVPDPCPALQPHRLNVQGSRSSGGSHSHGSGRPGGIGLILGPHHACGEAMRVCVGWEAQRWQLPPARRRRNSTVLQRCVVNAANLA